jgi:hypothetical protein
MRRCLLLACEATVSAVRPMPPISALENHQGPA